MHPTVHPRGVLPRAAVLISLLAEAGSDGLRLSDLVKNSALAQPTVHRLLADLVSVGAVERTSGRKYVIGSALEEIGLGQPTPQALQHIETTRTILQSLADEVGDTVYLALRGYSSLQYLLRCDGDSPVRVYSVAVGEVKPLASSYAGVALLAGLAPGVRQREIERILAQMPERWLPQNSSIQRERLETLIAQVQGQGWCGGIPVIPDVDGVACPVPRRTGAPVLGLTISAAASRLPPERIAMLGVRLTEVAEEVAAVGM
ncbi:helix-turn-helix domain-containing protein [Pseudoclavibacter sp. CFCC 13796]|uniref:IclR family transcriptional regulator n=1 Tax=Pseudoclavibacter sp. CFCC 13796 TaxID=2615179 RepID=UPI0013019BC3|nr:helix-turn-helix domain-containing protein [Pseudoclavibacter sp. CFCC 13796]KAB1659794.1 helix-turn-helix domain-containing protein [Pseudoclavibacter sp. CFCC 13796]